MKNPQKNLLNQNFNLKKKCSSCGLISNDVNRSVLMDKLLCIACLKDAIIGRTQDT